MKTKELKRNEGITLIALVITIIILLILAGISIAMLTGENGILTKATEANKQNENNTELERVKLAVNDARIDEDIENIKSLTQERLQSALDNEFGRNVAKVSEKQSDGSFIVTIGENEYIIEDGKDIIKNNIAQVTDKNPGEFEGEGTEASPYLIESIEDLVALSTNVNSGETYQGKYLKITQDLDFNSNKSYVDYTTKYTYDSTKDGYVKNDQGTAIKDLCTKDKGFITIGKLWEKGFLGNFNGNNATLKNLYMNIDNKPEKTCSFGLFGYIEGNEIKNISVTGKIDVSSQINGVILGGIIGYADCDNNDRLARIENCINQVNINCPCKCSLGGVVVAAWGNIENCINKGKIEVNDPSNSGSNVGGIAGEVGGLGYYVEGINNCTNLGEVRVLVKGGGYNKYRNFNSRRNSRI